MIRTPTRALLALLLFVPFTVAGCEDGTGPEALPSHAVGVVLNSVDNSLTVFPVDSPSASVAIGLGSDGTPVAVAASGSRAVVPLGLTPAVAVVDLAVGQVTRTIPLPLGSGATGAALFGGDSAIVTNPGLNTVSVLDTDAGTADLHIEVGEYPAMVVVDGGTAYVLNQRLDDTFLPAGPGTVTVLDLGTLTVTGTVQLSGLNPADAAVIGDRLYVLNSGTWGQGDGSVSVVDMTTGDEVDRVTGFGDFPGSLTLGPDGRLWISSFSYGIAVWDPVSGFIRSPAEAIQPDGVTSVSAVDFDRDGRLYALRPFCAPGEPDIAFRLDNEFEVESTVTVGNCPVDIEFTGLNDLP